MMISESTAKQLAMSWYRNAVPASADLTVTVTASPAGWTAAGRAVPAPANPLPMLHIDNMGGIKPTGTPRPR